MKAEFNDFLEDCISTGKCMDNYFLTQEQNLEIDDILHRYNDTTARIKIKKIICNV